VLRSGNFWIGVGTGVIAIYAYHMWQAKKSQKG
jgi:hypothetical protein